MKIRIVFLIYSFLLDANKESLDCSTTDINKTINNLMTLYNK